MFLSRKFSAEIILSRELIKKNQRCFSDVYFNDRLLRSFQCHISRNNLHNFLANCSRFVNQKYVINTISQLTRFKLKFSATYEQFLEDLAHARTQVLVQKYFGNLMDGEWSIYLNITRYLRA